MLRAAAIVVALIAAPAAYAAPCPVPPTSMSPAAFVKLANGADPVRLHDVAVRGRVELRQANVPISCRRCSFDKLVLRDAVVNRTLDLRGLRSVALLDAAGAEFKQPVLAGVGDGCPGIGRARFFFSTFDDFADFEGAAFGVANFGQARFRGPASFDHASFGRLASFAGASFEGGARFDDAVFARPVSFAGASFTGRAHFLRASFGRQPCFGPGSPRSADFTSTTFGGTAELAQSMFCGEATFQRTRFDGGASFLGAQFLVSSPPPERCDSEHPPDVGVTFDHASSAGRLDFGGALFGGRPQFLGVSARTLSLEGAVFDKCVPLELSDISSIEDLRLEPGAAGRIEDSDTQIHVLRAIGASASAREDLAVANDAHYRLLELSSEREGPVQRFFDHLFYRNIAGYLVRPYQPLLWLLGLAILASLVRTIWGRPPAGMGVRPSVRTPGRIERLLHWANRFLTELTRTLSPLQRAGPDAPLIRKVEGAVYAVLLVCFLIGLANSNPTLKQLVDALL